MLCVHIELLLEAAPKAPSSLSSLSPLFFLMHSRRSSRDGGWALYLVSSLLSRRQSSPVCSRVDTTSTSRVWNNREKKSVVTPAHTRTLTRFIDLVIFSVSHMIFFLCFKVNSICGGVSGSHISLEAFPISFEEVRHEDIHFFLSPKKLTFGFSFSLHQSGVRDFLSDWGRIK